MSTALYSVFLSFEKHLKIDACAGKHNCPALLSLLGAKDGFIERSERGNFVNHVLTPPSWEIRTPGFIPYSLTKIR